jgi:solute carrier family 25 phosphate transporter 3
MEEKKRYVSSNHNTGYYLKCFFAGLFPCGITHTLLTPLDIVKCRRQIYPGAYNTLREGIMRIWTENGIRGLYLGWQPTVIGYSLQGSTKYGFYEIFKDYYRNLTGEKFYSNNRTMIFLLSSATAEVIADCLLCPMESLKVRIQTSPPGSFPNTLIPAFNELKKEGFYGFYKGLLPIIFRQVPNTMVKFATYENTVKFFYTNILVFPKNEYSKFSQLIVTFLSGYVSGAICCFISNPADTIVSKIYNKKSNLNQSLTNSIKSIYHEIGFFGLWRGFSTRVVMVGTLSALEWLIYDLFKLMAGLETTGEK